MDDDNNIAVIKAERPKPKIKCVLKFASPISVTMIDSLGDIYIRGALCAIGIGLSHVFMGGVLTLIVIYGSHNNDDHAGICSFGVRTCNVQIMMQTFLFPKYFQSIW